MANNVTRAERYLFALLKGKRTIAGIAFTILVVMVGFGLIVHRINERQRIGNQILQAAEVRKLPKNVLAVVLARDDGYAEEGLNYKLLKLILRHSGKTYKLGLNATTLPQDEIIQSLRAGLNDGLRNPEAITVAMFGFDKSLTPSLRLIPIPIGGGLLGLRVGWIHKDHIQRTAGITTLEQLRELVLLQGTGWKDVKILDAAGLRTYTSRPLDILELVQYNRVDLYPRGITELERELSDVRRDAKDVVVDPNLLIVYPLAGFFYVHPSNRELASAIETGFRRALDNGAYQALLNQHLYTPWLKQQLNLRHRNLILLPNPEAEAMGRAVQPSDWIVPWDLIKRHQITTGHHLCSVARLRDLCG